MRRITPGMDTAEHHEGIVEYRVDDEVREASQPRAPQGLEREPEGTSPIPEARAHLFPRCSSVRIRLVPRQSAVELCALSVRQRKGVRLVDYALPEFLHQLQSVADRETQHFLRELRVHGLHRTQATSHVQGAQRSQGAKDRVTPLPESLVVPLLNQLAWVRRLHESDLARGGGRVEMPDEGLVIDERRVRAGKTT